MFAMYGFESRQILVEITWPRRQLKNGYVFRMTAVHKLIHATLKTVNQSYQSGWQKVGRRLSWKQSTSRLQEPYHPTRDYCTRALSDRWIGPYEVIKDKWDGRAYEWDIPARTRVHKVIHVSPAQPDYADLHICMPSPLLTVECLHFLIYLCI